MRRERKETTKTEKCPIITKTNLTDDIEKQSSFFDLRTTQGQLLFLLITIAISSLIQFVPNISFNQLIQKQSTTTIRNKENTILSPQRTKPIYWIYGKSPDQSHLKHVHLVLKRLGFEYGTNDTDWDLLWAHDYPFKSLEPMLHQHLNAHQRVNHFPGCGFITNKVDLAITNVKYIPKAFRLPRDRSLFQQYAVANPRKLFVQKHNQHRHIYIRNMSEINFNDNDTFLQEYIDKPFLVDGHKFDIGIYVIITSIDPLRVYIYSGDVLFRYCPAKYYPFDGRNLDKYVVGDDYLPTWEVPSLAKYYNEFGFGMKDSFDAYVREMGRDPSVVWQQAEDAIRIAILKQEPHMIEILKKFSRKHNFFELMRFDLVIDENLNVYLLEANMSPNLSSAHFQSNTLLYEQVIYNTLSLVGIGSIVARDSLRERSIDEENMISSDKNIAVFADKCLQNECSQKCSNQCKFCRPCLNSDDIQQFHAAYREHIHRGNTKRIFPIPIENNKLNSARVNGLSAKNKMMTEWFYGKCLMESSWCS